jgi:hypothetical protein
MALVRKDLVRPVRSTTIRILGGIVVQFLTSQIGANQTNFSQYAVGLLFGLVAYVVTHRLTRGKWPTIGPD